jgi:signal-transduction protein with cAMP-binding, CBS, and nucleotidyltransferase domain
MALMTEKHIRHLPVLEGKTVLGMLSIGDLVHHATIQEQEQVINQLVHYIQSA